MLELTVWLTPAHDPVRIDLHPSYGKDGELAHMILTAALTAEWPLVVAGGGEIIRLPTGSVHAFAVRELRG